MVRRPLLPAPWRPFALLVWVGAAVVLIVLSWHFGHGGGDRADAVLGAHVSARFAAHPRLLTTATRLGSPTAVIVGSVVLLLLCLAARRPRAAAFAVAASPAAGAMTEWVLKPLVHRQSHANVLVFPSGHTTGAFALAVTVVVLLLPRPDTRFVSTVARLVVAALALAAAAVVAIAVVALGWHFVTDTIGGAATAVVVVLGVAAVVDTAAGRAPG